MAVVRIPNEHFTQSVRRNYQFPDMALLREFLQNSVDAGAKNINFAIDNCSLTVVDDGCGMDEHVLVNALLTMSGSHKGANSIGGFGAAKEILLFQHESYEIMTRDLYVKGAVLEYDLRKVKPINGTTISVVFHKNYDFDPDAMHAVADEYLASCQTGCAITLDGKAVKPNLIASGDPAIVTTWCRIYVRNVKDHREHAVVRINGVMMFKKYVGSIKKEIIIEITKPSTEILTVNRDGFTWQYDQELSKVLNDIVINKETFGRLYDKTLKYAGRANSDRAIDKIMSAIGKLAPKGKTKEIAAVVGTAIRDAETRKEDAAHAAVQALSEAIREHAPDSYDKVQNLAADLVEDIKDDLKSNVDFYILVSKRNMNVVPDWLHPSKLGDRKSTIIKLWKRCIRLILVANNLDYKFTVGWTLNDDRTEALHKTAGNGIHIFALNPDNEWLSDSVHYNVWHHMLMVAAHEVAHARHQHHDEAFMQHYDDLLLRTICHIKSWWNEYLDAKKNETI